MFSATATDAAGNVGEVENYLVVIQAAAPPVSTESPAVTAPAPPAPAPPAVSAPAPPAMNPPVPTAVIKVKANRNRTKLFVNVNPNKGKGYWRIKVYRKVEKGDVVTWKKVGKTLRTKTSKETRKINLGKGTYRVKVMKKFGMQGAVSKRVRLVR